MLHFHAFLIYGTFGQLFTIEQMNSVINITRKKFKIHIGIIYYLI